MKIFVGQVWHIAKTRRMTKEQMIKTITALLFAGAACFGATVTVNDNFNAYGLHVSTAVQLTDANLNSGPYTVASNNFSNFTPNALLPYLTGLTFNQTPGGLDLTWGVAPNPIIASIPTAHFDGSILGAVGDGDAVLLTINRGETISTQVAAAPEPASYAIVGLGLVSLWAFYRRKQQARATI